MKKLLFLSIFVFMGFLSQAQMRFQAEYVAIRPYNDTTQVFGDWPIWQPSNVIILVKDEGIDIYSNVEQHYTFISAGQAEKYQELNILRIDALDVNNSRVTIEFVYYTTTGKSLIYVRWTNLQLAYQVKRL